MILPLCCLLWHLATPAWAQETLSLKECREMALKYNKEMAASVKQTESARYTAKSYKGNFFPNFTVSGTGLYSNADGSYGIAGGNLPVFLPDGTGQFNPGQPAGFAYFPGINLDYKIGWVYMGGVQMEQPLYMGGHLIDKIIFSVKVKSPDDYRVHGTIQFIILEVMRSLIYLNICNMFGSIILQFLKGSLLTGVRIR